MRIAYAVVSIMLITPLSWAGNMTFQFRNPNFGGNPNNGAFMLNEARAQNSYKDPSFKDFSVDTPSALDNFTRDPVANSGRFADQYQHRQTRPHGDQ